MSNIKEQLPKQLQETIIKKIASNEEIIDIISAYVAGRGDSIPADKTGISFEISLTYPDPKAQEEAVIE